LGIGLAFSRQIAEGHGGMLTLENRASGRGCEARLRLPLRIRHSSLVIKASTTFSISGIFLYASKRLGYSLAGQMRRST
jgi:hypothetical protein